jgi:hypothetical protein
MMRLLVVTVLALAALTCACAAGGTDAGGAPAAAPTAARTGVTRFFAPTSVWNRPLARSAPLAADSGALVTELQRQVRSAGPWIATTKFSVPIVTVDRRQRRVRVKLDTTYPPLQRAFASVPVPPRSTPAAGSDRHLVVWQPSTDTMWEFWLMQRRGDGWHARWGARIPHVSRSAGVNASPTGATASGLPLVGGLMTLDELRRGRIDHALALSIPSTRAGVAAWPATRTDGETRGATAIPEGTRFRLDPRVDVDRLGLPRPVEAMARAAQRYGMIVRDKAGAVVFYGQAPSPSRPREYDTLFHGAYPNNLLGAFPWKRLQVVRSPVRRVTQG